MTTYQDSAAAKAYLEFSQSPDGQLQKQALFKIIHRHLGNQAHQTILDAGCGDGWLVNELTKSFPQVCGCDLSTVMIEAARRRYPHLPFEVCDLTQTTPFAGQLFDAVILNLVFHDLQNQSAALRHLSVVMQPGSTLLISIVNPYYGYPVGVWKRGAWGRLVRQKPKLRLRPYFGFVRGQREFKWRKNIPVRFYPLPEQLNNLLGAGFELVRMADVQSDMDSPKYDFQYRLYRFPLILFLICRKKL